MHAEDIEEFRDRSWCREDARRIDNAYGAERFIDRVGFAACMTDSRRPGPSLYVAVCGRRDAVMPRNVQTDEEASQTWLLKDELVRRGKVYYAKLARGKATFISAGMLARVPMGMGSPREIEMSTDFACISASVTVLVTIVKLGVDHGTDRRSRGSMR